MAEINHHQWWDKGRLLVDVPEESHNWLMTKVFTIRVSLTAHFEEPAAFDTMIVIMVVVVVIIICGSGHQKCEVHL